MPEPNDLPGGPVVGLPAGTYATHHPSMWIRRTDAASDWYESILGRVQRDADEQIGGLLRGTTEWAVHPEWSQVVQQVYRKYVAGDSLHAICSAAKAFQQSVSTMDRQALLEAIGEQSGYAMGYPVTVAVLDGERSGYRIDWAVPTRGAGVSPEQSVAHGFGPHIDAVAGVARLNRDIRERVQRFESTELADPRRSHRPHRCSGPVLSALISGFRRSGGVDPDCSDFTEIVVECSGSCTWLAGVDEKVLADLISWGWLHHRAPMTPMLSDLNFRYHGRAIGASVPRTRENRATGFCAAHFPEQIGAELDGARTRTPGTEAADASIRGLFDRIRSALLDVLDTQPGFTGVDVDRVRTRLKSIVLEIRSLTEDPVPRRVIPTDAHRSLVEWTELLNRDRMHSAHRSAALVSGTSFFQHSRGRVVIGTSLADSARLHRAADPVFTCARIGFVMGHELGHAVVTATETADDSSIGRWLHALSAFYSTVTVDAGGGERLAVNPARILRESSADVLGLAAAVVASRRYAWTQNVSTRPSTTDPTFLRSWFGFWENRLPLDHLRARSVTGPHAVPAARCEITPELVSTGGATLTGQPAGDGPAPLRLDGVA
jgi:hypothetical protein